MKTSLFGALALLVVASPAFANISLRWAPVLRETLPAVHRSHSREVTADTDGPVLRGLDARHGTLIALSRAGIEDLEGLEDLLRAPDSNARAAALGADTRELEDLRLSLEVLAPTVRRLQARGLKPYSTTRSRFIPALARALEEQTVVSARPDAPAQAVAVIDRPQPNEMRDAPADLPRPQSALSRLRAALARAAGSLTTK